MQLSERAYPILSRVCIGVGIAFLVLSAFGNWRFGWSLSTNPIDQWWLAIMYAGSDVAAGVLVATGATMLRHPGWRWKVGGTVALVPATILVALSVLSTFGMMSGRIAVLSGQKAALVVDEGRLKWLRGQTMNRELPRAERRAFLLEERAAAKKTREAAAVVSDNQAVAVANAAATVGVKLSVEQAQITLTFISSTMPMTIKFVCIGLGFFLYGARTAKLTEPAKKTQDGSGSGGSGEPRKLTVVHPEPPKPAVARTMQPASASHRFEPPKVRQDGARVLPGLPTGKLSAFDRAYEAALANPHWSTRRIADEAGCSQTTSVRVKRRLRGKADAVVRRYAGNGGGKTFHSLALG